MKKNKLLIIFSLMVPLITFVPSKTNLRETLILEQKIKKISKNDRIRKLFLEEIYNLTKSFNYEIEYITFVKDFSNNIFAVATYSPGGYAILHVKTGIFIEVSTNAIFEYEKSEIENKYYVPLYGFFNESGKKIKYENTISAQDSYSRLNHLKEISNKLNTNYTKYTNFENLEKLKGSKEFIYKEKFNVVEKTSEIEICKDAPKAKYEVPYSWYFRLNDKEFPKNNGNGGGNCGYVSMAMMLLYADMFWSAGYLSVYDYENFITKANGNYGSVVPTFSNDFIDYHWPNSSSLVPLDAGDLVDEFMNGKSIDYDCKTTIWVFFKSIDDLIKDGMPVSYYGSLYDKDGKKINHAVTVYGSYDDGRLLAHYGGVNMHQVIMSKAGMFELGGYMYIENYEPHVHRRYILNNEKAYCGCGFLMSC